MKLIKRGLWVFLLLCTTQSMVCDSFPRTKIGTIKNESGKTLFVKLTKPREDTLMDSYSNSATFYDCYVEADTVQNLNVEEYGLKYFDSAGCHVYFYDCDILRKYLKGTDGNQIHPDAYKKAFLRRDMLTPQQIAGKHIMLVFKGN